MAGLMCPASSISLSSRSSIECSCPLCCPVQVVAVVHQYDRSDALKEQYAREYVWLDQGELNRR